MADDRPPNVTTSNSAPRITVAFPFSAIKMQEASDEVRELARIVAELVEEVAKLSPSERVDALAQQTNALIAKLSS